MQAEVIVAQPAARGQASSEDQSGSTEPVMVQSTSIQTSPAWGGASGSPWGKTLTPVPCSLQEVMSEELAVQLQKQEEDSKPKDSELVDLELARMMAEQGDTSDDFLLAQMLQHEFDKEHDAVLQKEEDKWNGTSKVKISFQNYRSIHPTQQRDVNDADDEEVWEDDGKDEPIPQFSRGGISGKGKNIVTKHDPNICGKKNAMRVMDQFPPEFETGDGHKLKMRLPNHVYNKLKRHSAEETKRSHRVHEKKEFSTAEQAVDEKTRLILYKIVNSGILESVEGVVSTGKESVVFHGTGGNMTEQLVPEECAIKVFKTTLSEFKNRFEYVRGDVRFLRDEYSKWNSRKIIKIWAEKELANLKKMESCGIPCPKAVVLKKHILVMSFLGDHQVAAPKLKDARLSVADLQIAYEQCINSMMKMYKKAGLVHADLSEYNMLWWKDQVHFIDVAQAVDIMHPRAGEFLLRDCINVCQFFKSSGVVGVPTPYQLFNQITGMGLTGEGKEFLAQIQQFEKSEEKLQMGKGKDYPFDYFFEKSRAEREEHQRKMEQLFKDSDTESEEEENEEQSDPETTEEGQTHSDKPEATESNTASVHNSVEGSTGPGGQQSPM